MGAPTEHDTGPAAAPAQKSRMGLARIGRATRYSVTGLASAFRHEAAFRQELLLAAVLIPVACLLPVALPSRALLVAAVLGVLVVELLNSAIEAVVDRVSIEPHELAGRAKDIASAAVFLSLVGCAVVWVVVLWDAFA